MRGFQEELCTRTRCLVSFCACNCHHWHSIFLELAGNISCLSVGGFLSHEHCYLLIFFYLDSSSENHLSSGFAFLLGILLDFYSYFSLLPCTLERWECRCQNGLISSKGQFRENGWKGSLEVTWSNPHSRRDPQGQFPRTICAQTAFEYCQTGTVHKLPGQTVPVLSHPHRKKAFCYV